MNKLVEKIRCGGAQMYLACLAVLLCLVCSIYYAIQSNLDGCFNVVFLALLLAGAVVALVDIVAGIHVLLPVSSIFWSAAVGVILYEMLPTLSDVWNNVVMVGGNLFANIAYTILAFVVVLLSILACFVGRPSKT